MPFCMANHLLQANRWLRHCVPRKDNKAHCEQSAIMQYALTNNIKKPQASKFVVITQQMKKTQGKNKLRLAWQDQALAY